MKVDDLVCLEHGKVFRFTCPVCNSEKREVVKYVTYEQALITLLKDISNKLKE